MTEPSSPRPAPGPPSPADAAGQGRSTDRFVGLDQRPVAEHVAVFDAEHGRLQRELGTIDQL